MTEVHAHYSPLAIFPETTFTSFYTNLSQRLGIKPTVRITALEPAAWQEMQRLIEKGDYLAVVRMADAIDPANSLNSIKVEISESGESFSFGKILADGKPVAVALMPIGNFADHDTYKTPAGVTEGCTVKSIRYEPVKWLSSTDTAKKFDLESMLNEENLSGDKWGIASLAFLSVLDGIFGQLKVHHPNEHARLFGKDSITIGDIGCGFMPYGSMMAYYFLALGKQVVIAGIDPEVSESDLRFYERKALELRPGSRVKFVTVPLAVEYSEESLKQHGIEHFDLVTMFNPRDVISIGDLPESFKGSALILTALDDNYSQHWLRDSSAGARRGEVIDSLVNNGYMVISENLNPHILDISRAFGHKYNPIIVAQSLSELLKPQLSS